MVNQRTIDILQQQWIIDKCYGKCLHLGCGMKPIQGAINIDANPERWAWADVAANGLCLPFQDGVFDSVVSSHVLTIFADISQVLGELARVMAVGGRMAHVIADHRYAPSRAGSSYRFEKQLGDWHGPEHLRKNLSAGLGLEVITLENFTEFNWSFKFEATRI